MRERKQDRPELKRQAVNIDFDGGTLTSDGGLALLREVDRTLDPHRDRRHGTQHPLRLQRFLWIRDCQNQ